jgi:hypothetical protein
LLVNGFEVDVGAVRAELEIAGLTVHQRIVPGHVSIALTWSESRRLKHRVARLWPLSMPWDKPTVTPVQDDARGEITISGSDEDLPPGYYLAEVGVDDGWATVRRPDLNASWTRQFRLGTEDDERHWLARQRYDDPYAVLASACTLGRISRSLSPDEVQLVTPAALEALWVLREQGDGTSTSAVVTATAGLVTSAPDALSRGVEAAALEWSAVHNSSVLAPVLDLLPHIQQSSAAGKPLSDSAKLWELCSPLAAALDLPYVEVPEVKARCELGLGATLGEARGREIIPNTRGRHPALQPFANMPLDALDALRRASSLVPKRPLDLDTQASVQFEWLIADKLKVFSAKDWASAYRGLGTRSSELRADLGRDFDAIRAPSHWAGVFPEMLFPELVYVAALHVITGTPSAYRAAGALREFLPSSSGIITSSLVLAAGHAHLH